MVLISFLLSGISALAGIIGLTTIYPGIFNMLYTTISGWFN